MNVEIYDRVKNLVGYVFDKGVQSTEPGFVNRKWYVKAATDRILTILREGEKKT